MPHLEGDVLVVMARQPAPGKVKTRLARMLGNEAACRVYSAFLRDIARDLKSAPWTVLWAVSPPGSNLRAFIGEGFTQLDQRGDNLAKRMANCFADLFARGAGRVAMIGTDAPHLSHAEIAGSFAALAAHDVAIIPSEDGGYVLIAMTSRHDIFTGVKMSTSTVLQQTLRLVDAAHLPCAVLPATFDVDEEPDLQRLRALIDTGRADLPHTRVLLAKGVKSRLATKFQRVTKSQDAT